MVRGRSGVTRSARRLKKARSRSAKRIRPKPLATWNGANTRVVANSNRIPSRQSRQQLENSTPMKPTASQNLIAILIVLMVFSQNAPAVSPPPDGGYPNGNTAEGQTALLNLTTGSYNTAVGFVALRADTTTNFNTAVGAGALFANTGDLNTATGAAALLRNTTGDGNTASGAFALFQNTIGRNNAAFGQLALGNNDSDFNSAFGWGALRFNSTGTNNTACGANALFMNDNGTENTAVGVKALNTNVSSSRNTAIGALVLQQHQSGDYNNGVGGLALLAHNTGQGNNAIGDSALTALISGDNNTAVGDSAGSSLTNGSNNIYIGAALVGVASESDHTYVGNINTTGLSGTNVTIDLNTGLLGHATSSRRYKEDIKPIKDDSETIYRLNPVSFRYRKEIDRNQARAFGLIAEEVAEIDPDLVARNSQGQVETVRYEMVNAMLLNEFLKEHRTVVELKQQVAALTATVKEQSARIEKVSAQLETGKSAQQVVQVR